YRAALGTDHAATELARMAGTQFDPEVVKVFLPLIDRLPALSTS
nr:HD family phosphohydrolase [Acidimicrobiia bacterium]